MLSRWPAISMLTAHAKTTSEDFLAQLRTFVIALGLGPQVIDCVDNLVGASGLESIHEKELEECEDETRIKILTAVKDWAIVDDDTVKELLDVIRNA